jgi:hypothetical protein
MKLRRTAPMGSSGLEDGSGQFRPDSRDALLALLLGAGALAFQIQHLAFGLPEAYNFHGFLVPSWFPDESKEIAQIQSLLAPKTSLVFFSYPPFQYLIVAFVLLPLRLLEGQLPPEWMLALTSRYVSAISVAGSSALICLIGSRFNRVAGAIAGALFAVSPIAALIGRDTKPIALGGLMLLAGIWMGFRIVDRGLSARRCIAVGSFLGLSAMCSHLSVSYFHLPVLCCLLRTKHERGQFFPPVAQNRQQSKSKGPALLAAVAVVLIMSCGFALYLTVFHKAFLLDLAGRIWDSQAHGRPFRFHLPEVEAHYEQLKGALALVTAALVFLLFYLGFRRRLSRLVLLGSLRWYEASYGAVAAVVVGVLVVSSVLNPLVPFSLLRWTQAMRPYLGGDIGYYGFYPGELGPPSFFLSILPQCLGSPLLLVSAIGLVCLLCARGTPWPHRHLLLLTFLPFGLQILTWNTSFRASRFAYTLVFLACLLSGLFLSMLCRHRHAGLRALGWAASFAVFAYTAVYAVAYVETRSYDQDGRVKAAEWVLANVPKDASIAVTSRAQLPRLLGPLEGVPGYRYVSLEDQPDYCVMDGAEHFIMEQYFARESRGYRYTRVDWLPSALPPGPEQISAYNRILNTGEYALVHWESTARTDSWQRHFKLRLLFDPAEYMHGEVFVFRRIKSK